jgi:hypothetical protein
MTVRKGLSAILNTSPNFSNQALENAINELKIGWVIKSIDLDTAIENNTVLTVSQKNDVKDTINNISYLNAGRYLNDLVRHTNTILDGTIMPIPVDEIQTFTFLEALNTVRGLQSTIPNLYGVSAKDKGRSIDDHFGSLNNIFTTTDDSTQPVFTTLKESITFINDAGLSSDTAYQTAMDNLRTFINSTRDDSTDFQQTLDTFASAVATAATNFDTALQSSPYDVKRTQLIADRDTIVTQQARENTNITSLRTYTQSLANLQLYMGIADDANLRTLMIKISQNDSWRQYFENYEENAINLNPIYTTQTDSDKDALIDKIYTDSGYPDVRDALDLIAVAAKAKRDSRIDTAGFDPLTAAQVITKACEQLGITTANRTIYTQSETLLNNMNQEDRDRIARALDLNEQSNTLS